MNIINPRVIELSTTAKNTGKSVLYIMSRDQRVQANHALLAAKRHADSAKLPLAVIFCLQPKARYRTKQHYEFMILGLRQVEADLEALGIPFIMLIGDPYTRLNRAIEHYQPAAVYFDFSPLRSPRKLQKRLVSTADTSFYVVDTHNIVPVWQVSDKQEYGARTIRPKIHRLLADYLIEPEQVQKHQHTWPLTYMKIADLESRITALIDQLPSSKQDLAERWPSGERAAQTMLDDFIAMRLRGYSEKRNDPTKDNLSELSPYLHFGQISSLQIVLILSQAAAGDGSLQTDIDTLIEEMVVRKELSDNFCYYNSSYDSLSGAPEWAQKTLQKHASDPREHVYSRSKFELGKTHDPAWNAAQLQMDATGKMHGYMRMYWAKKVLEWSENPKQALDTLIYLNDTYSLDGGDPNGYVGMLWSVAGLHDRPWGERAVYGSVRSMVYAGLKRKFAIEDYIKKWENPAQPSMFE